MTKKLDERAQTIAAINPAIGRNIGKLLHDLKRQGVTQREFAERVGVSTTAVSEWKNGHTRVSTYNARQICEAFPEYSIDFVQGRTPYRNDEEQGEAQAYEAALFEDCESYNLEQIRRAMADLMYVNGYAVHASADPGTGRQAYKVCKGGAAVVLTSAQLSALEAETCAYVGMRLSQIFERGCW